MREITHLVLLGRVSGGTAKKGDIDLSEQDPAKIVKKGDTELTDWRPAVYVAGQVVWHTAMHSRSRDWVKTGKAQPEQMFSAWPSELGQGARCRRAALHILILVLGRLRAPSAR